MVGVAVQNAAMFGDVCFDGKLPLLVLSLYGLTKYIFSSILTTANIKVTSKFGG